MNDAHWLLNSNTPKVLLGLPSMSAVLSPVSMCLSGYCLYKISTLSLLIMTFMRQPLMNQGHAIMSNVFETAPIYDRSTTTSHEDASGSKFPNAFMYATGASMILITSMLAILTCCYCLKSRRITCKWCTESTVSVNDDEHIAQSVSETDPDHLDEMELEYFDY